MGTVKAYVVDLGIVVASCMTARPEPAAYSGPPATFQPTLTIPAEPEPVEVAALSTALHASGGSCVVARLVVGTTVATGDADTTGTSQNTIEPTAASKDQTASADKSAGSTGDEGGEIINEAFLERLLTGPSQEPEIEQIAEDESVIVPPSAKELEDLATDYEDEEVAAVGEDEDEVEESMASVRGRLATALARLQAMTATIEDEDEIPEEPESQDITAAEALAAFECVAPRMHDAYAASGHRLASTYSQWYRHNGPPFRAVRLNRRYVSVYANVHAFDDSAYMLARRVPIGAAVALPSFIVDAAGVVQIGPLLMMEKMPRGFDSPRGNWRYTKIDSVGQIVGITNGKGGNFLLFCEECDALGADAAYRSILDGEIFDPDAEVEETVLEESS